MRGPPRESPAGTPRPPDGWRSSELVKGAVFGPCVLGHPICNKKAHTEPTWGEGGGVGQPGRGVLWAVGCVTLGMDPEV